ncbi:protein kinase [Methylomonas montana]|uniref:protein kinase domain-containing protein n=1 Tax=Methylomonas montana TaxID=3058963 RepID=UPI002658BA6B|nr:protein kinase [Methylomonas montana]WKJ92194.1 protein kinase [Methylomonas montana]
MFVDILFHKKRFKIPERITGTNGKFYTVQEQIAEGGNAVVCECADESDGEVYAVKFLTNTREDSRSERFEIERQLMQSLTALRHDHLIGSITSGTVDSSTFDKRQKECKLTLPFVIMERANCSLREFVKNEKVPIEYEIYSAQFRGLVSALELLHRHAIHRDIKPDNILVIGERWVISDFGLCSLLDGCGGQDLTPSWQVPGPRFWMSPEANNKAIGLSEEITFASDVFQLAAVFWWVVNRRHPSGILSREDWIGAEYLYEPVARGLQHSLNRRFSTANEFGTAVVQAIGF